MSYQKKVSLKRLLYDEKCCNFELSNFKQMKKMQLFFIPILICSLTMLFQNCKKEVDNNDNPQPITSVKDIEGNVYQAITIGNQVWTKQNLKTKKLNDGGIIPIVTEDADWTNKTSPAMSFYNNQEAAHKHVFGGLYNWYAVNTNKLCPVGWRIPNSNDYQTLMNTLGGAAIAGGKLKDTGLKQAETGYWEIPNEGATNSSHFTGLPGGYRSANASFAGFGSSGNWWLRDEMNTELGQYLMLHFQQTEAKKEQISKKTGMSIRCIKQ